VKHNSTVGIETGLDAGQLRNYESIPSSGKKFLPSPESAAHLAVQSLVAGALPLGVKQLGHEADHSPVYEVMYEWSYTSSPPCDFTACTRTSSPDNTKVTFLPASLSVI